jgi:hydrogenase nickel incorporation protein HypB
MKGTPRLVQVRESILKHNDVLARELRRRFHDAGVFVVSLVSSPGAGKTEFLRRALEALVEDFRVAALVGDLATANDAERLSRSNAPVKQITTGTVCHLDAQMVEDALSGWNLDDIDLLFFENVGNLVCPSSYDLGENLRIVLMSTTEGEDKPLKYPTIFNSADVAVITKADIAKAVDFDLAKAVDSIHRVRPGMEIFTLSAKTGVGMSEWIDWLKAEASIKEHRKPKPTAAVA